MLILSRKRGESVMIGDEVEVHVVDIGDGKVRLGVTGPAWVPVHQREHEQQQGSAVKRPISPAGVQYVEHQTPQGENGGQHRLAFPDPGDRFDDQRMNAVEQAEQQSHHRLLEQQV